MIFGDVLILGFGVFIKMYIVFFFLDLFGRVKLVNFLLEVVIFVKGVVFVGIVVFLFG